MKLNKAHFSDLGIHSLDETITVTGSPPTSGGSPGTGGGGTGGGDGGSRANPLAAFTPDAATSTYQAFHYRGGPHGGDSGSSSEGGQVYGNIGSPFSENQAESGAATYDATYSSDNNASDQTATDIISQFREDWSVVAQRNPGGSISAGFRELAQGTAAAGYGAAAAVAAAAEYSKGNLYKGTGEVLKAIGSFKYAANVIGNPDANVSAALDDLSLSLSRIFNGREDAQSIYNSYIHPGTNAVSPMSETKLESAGYSTLVDHKSTSSVQNIVYDPTKSSLFG
ncbi:hypothetical protein [Asaia sp. As-1742]|uniref:hypothetical protein n=1 Tax=Asaia sp. As-1742 TaxID=2608325 RepID=UPI001420F52E|nr:hypothetical protein [Asaia sp. As-1742]NIE81643.1 hypothetical protein [Asaia sp. As-1742]